MLADEISNYESNTINWLKSKGQLTKDSYLGIEVLNYDPPRSGYYYTSVKGKRSVVLHFTAGYLGGDLSTLSQQDYHVSVPFVVARGGTIIKLFDPKLWSYHLGPGAVGGNKQCSSETIGIEISNIGYLEHTGSWLWTYTGDKYCRANQSEYYTVVPSYRGKTHFASFTDAQYTSLKTLVKSLSAEFSVPNKLIKEEDRYEVFKSTSVAQQYKGISSHVNFRSTGKWDIGPAFKWDALSG